MPGIKCCDRACLDSAVLAKVCFVRKVVGGAVVLLGSHSTQETHAEVVHAYVAPVVPQHAGACMINPVVKRL